jgi:cytochrome bd ubiquinol oxidase subunit I
VVGLNPLQAQDTQQYGPGNYVPNVFIQYWSMRVMAYGGAGTLLLALWGGWLAWRRKLADARWFQRLAIWVLPLPFLMNTAGWMLTENGRQPWIVQGLQLVRDAVSPSVSVTAIVVSLTVFVLLYAALGVVDVLLMTHFARKELDPDPDPAPADAAPADAAPADAAPPALHFTY